MVPGVGELLVQHPLPDDLPALPVHRQGDEAVHLPHRRVVVGPRRVVDGAPPRQVIPEQVRVVRVDHLHADGRAVVPAGVGEALGRQVGVLVHCAVGGHDEVDAQLAPLEHRHGARRGAGHGLVDDELADRAAGAVAALELEHVVVQEVGDLEAGRRRELLRLISRVADLIPASSPS